MKTRKTHILIIITAILFTFLYLFSGAKPLSKEYHFYPEWTIDLDNPDTKPTGSSSGAIYFKLGQNMGFFSEDGELTNFITFPSKATISDYYYATYNTENKSTVIYNNKSEVKGTIDLPGYPFFVNDRIYNFLPGGASFTRHDENGKLLWTIEATLPITAFASNKNYTAAGYADGTINVINNEDGSTEYEFNPGGSNYPVILGLDISDNQKYIACICGHEQQRFIIAENDGQKVKIIYHKYIDSDTNRRTLINICNDNNTVYSIFDKNLNIFDIKKQTSKNIPFDGKILNIEETDCFIYMLGKSENTYTVYLVEKTHYMIGKFSFEADNAFLTTFNNNLYIGKDYTISKIKPSKE
ncbi:MAG: hypothetical protein IKX23_05075 [Treponema sp.]|nr:hypothetical protein [Treponema sp.]